jgi:hypothetical protein
MFTLIFAISIIAANPANGAAARKAPSKDHAAFVQEMQAEMDADVVLMSPAGPRLVLSALLCADEQRLLDVRSRFLRSSSQTAIALALAYQETLTSIDTAKLTFQVLSIERRSCSESDVDLLAQCLGDVPPKGCSTGKMAGYVAAALRLRSIQR